VGDANNRERLVERVEMVITQSYRQAGRDYGEAYAADIRRQIAAYEPVFDVLGMDREAAAQRAQKEVLPATERAFSDYVDELRGRAEGAGVAFGHLFLLNCMEEVWSWVGPEKMHELEERAAGHNPGGRCTTFALSRGGRTLIGHNEDWNAVDLDTTVLVHDVTVPSGTRFLALQFVGIVPWAGINSHGLAITANTLPNTDAVPGAANAFVCRRLLECQSLDEVWDCMRTPARGTGTYVLAADAQGSVWAMETSARRAARRLVDVWTAETNHFTDEAMVAFGAQPVSEDSLGRLVRAKELLVDGMAGGEDLLDLARRVLADHRATGGRTICGHPQSNSVPLLQMATITTTIYEPVDRRLWVTLAPTCEREPQLFEFN
jgi:isopenicillin-N N-acyltransferase-like protein